LQEVIRGEDAVAVFFWRRKHWGPTLSGL